MLKHYHIYYDTSREILESYILLFVIYQGIMLIDYWKLVKSSHYISPLNFYEEYLFGFETLVFAVLGISSLNKQFVTLQRERKT